MLFGKKTLTPDEATEILGLTVEMTAAELEDFCHQRKIQMSERCKRTGFGLSTAIVLIGLRTTGWHEVTVSLLDKMLIAHLAPKVSQPEMHGVVFLRYADREIQKLLHDANGGPEGIAKISEKLADEIVTDSEVEDESGFRLSLMIHVAAALRARMDTVQDLAKKAKVR